MTLALIVFACCPDLSACRRERFDAPGYASALQIVAGWIGEHPGYVVQGWTWGR